MCGFMNKVHSYIYKTITNQVIYNRCASALYFTSVMSQTYSIIIDQRISEPGHGKEIVDELNSVDKRYIYQLMSKVQLPESIIFD